MSSQSQSQSQSQTSGESVHDDEEARLAILRAECARRFSAGRKTKGERRISCHMCGNIRKTIAVCSNSACPQVFCRNCVGKVLEQHGREAFMGGCPLCKGLCCCALTKTAEVCANKYHCYRKCHVVKREDRQPQEITHPLVWHEPQCLCSKDFIDGNIVLVDNDDAPASAEKPVLEKTAGLEKKRTHTGAAKKAGARTELPSLRTLFGDTPDSLVHLSMVSESPMPLLGYPYSPFSSTPTIVQPPRQVPPEASASTASVSHKSAYSFFDECEEEFRKGLRKVNIQTLMSKATPQS